MIELSIEDCRTVDHLIQDLEDGVITPEDRKKLMTLMRENLSVRELYLKHIEMVALLQESAESRAELGTIPVSQEMVTQERRRSAMVSLTYGIAALLLLSVGLLIFQVSQRPASDRDWIVMEGSEDAVYTVVYSDDESRGTKSLQAGDRVTLNQGLVKFSFPSGVVAIIEGPSNLELTSDSSVKMNGGLAWFRVPEAGHGFTVETERMNVVDLGTEFGMWFDGNENLQVHVAKGRVRVEPRLRGMAKVELVKDEAMTFDVYGRGTPVESKTSLFRQTFTRSMPYLHWSFDQLEDGGFKAEGTMPGASEYQAELRHMRGAVTANNLEKCQVDGRYGGAFSMRGGGLFGESSFAGIGGNAPRTVAMWIRHREAFFCRESLEKRTPYCVWGATRPGRMWKIGLWDDHGDRLYTSTQDSDQMAKLGNVSSEQWIHIASVYTGRMMDDGFPEILHYINGELGSTQPDGKGFVVDTDVSSEEAETLTLGATMQSKAGDRTVDGDIDELYILRGVMSEGEIRHLMQTNRVEFSSN